MVQLDHIMYSEFATCGWDLYLCLGCNMLTKRDQGLAVAFWEFDEDAGWVEN